MAEANVQGLAEKMAKSCVISYTMPLTPWLPEERMPLAQSRSLASELFPDWSKAGANDSDLYYTKSILVTTIWNKNTDVFDPMETWMARSTPVHKPTNIEHDEKQTVGHITDCFGMTVDHQIIPDNIVAEELPQIFHLVNGAVIYKGWRDEQLAARASKLIDEIEQGKKYVSMECMFTNFSYAVIDSNNKCSVVARDENSAWMTKHLRAYGGTGEVNGYKIGRLLRNITFSGKGYVDKPANPESIIFSDGDGSIASWDAPVILPKSSENTLLTDIGVLNRCDDTTNNGEITMASEVDPKIAELQAKLDEALQSNAAMQEQLAKIDGETTKARILELENELTGVKATIESNTKVIEDLTAKCDTEKKMAEEAKKCKAELEVKLAEMVQAQITASRINLLVDGGMDREVASKKVSTYANLSDEQFSELSTDLLAAVKKSEEMKKDKKEEKREEKEVAEDLSKDANESKADEKVLENVKANEEINLSVTSDKIDETKTMRLDLQSVIASRLGIEVEKE